MGRKSWERGRRNKLAETDRRIRMETETSRETEVKRERERKRERKRERRMALQRDS